LKVCWTKAKYNPTLDVHMGKHSTLKEKNAWKLLRLLFKKYPCIWWNDF
jgi:hypothetical protein